jgi:Gram-negative bacterial TonB protein C-terminal
MNKSVILLISIFILWHAHVEAQKTRSSDSTQTFEKAKYLKGDLTEFLSKNVKYPDEAYLNKIEGDVIFSFVINKAGRLDNLSLVKSPDLILSTNSISAFNLIDGQWSPSLIDGRPADKRYSLIFRYRVYINSQPPDYKKTAEKNAKKQKFEKALKLYDSAIKDNKYDFILFESRARIKEILGDTEGARQDQLLSENLKKEVMAVVNINAVGITRRTVTIEKVRVNNIH